MAIAVGGAPARPRLAGPPPADRHHRHHRLPRLDRRRGRHQAPQREVAAGHRAPAPGRRHRRRPAGDDGRHREAQDRGARRSPGLSEPVDVTPSKDGKVALVSFTMGGSQNDDANRDIVREVRTRARPGRLRQPAGRPDATSRGDAAYSVDVTKVYADGVAAHLRVRPGPVVPAHARRLPLDRHPDQGDPAQPALDRRGLRRPRPRLPGRLVRRAARASRRAASSRAGSRSSSSRSCSGYRWTTTCSS